MSNHYRSPPGSSVVTFAKKRFWTIFTFRYPKHPKGVHSGGQSAKSGTASSELELDRLSLPYSRNRWTVVKLEIYDGRGMQRFTSIAHMQMFGFGTQRYNIKFVRIHVELYSARLCNSHRLHHILARMPPSTECKCECECESESKSKNDIGWMERDFTPMCFPLLSLRFSTRQGRS